MTEPEEKSEQSETPNESRRSFLKLGVAGAGLARWYHGGQTYGGGASGPLSPAY
jgi:hypothetical protein